MGLYIPNSTKTDHIFLQCLETCFVPLYNLYLWIAISFKDIKALPEETDQRQTGRMRGKKLFGGGGVQEGKTKTLSVFKRVKNWVLETVGGVGRRRRGYSSLRATGSQTSIQSRASTLTLLGSDFE